MYRSWRVSMGLISVSCCLLFRSSSLAFGGSCGWCWFRFRLRFHHRCFLGYLAVAGDNLEAQQVIGGTPEFQRNSVPPCCCLEAITDGEPVLAGVKRGLSIIADRIVPQDRIILFLD